MRIPRLPVVVAAVAIPVLAGGAIAVANSVSARPGPQVVIPARTSTTAPTTLAHHRRGTDDRAVAGHDEGDDHGRDGTTTPTTVSTTNPTNPTNPTATTVPDDRGDDGPGHDGGDDHRGPGGDDHRGPGGGGDDPGGGPGRG